MRLRRATHVCVGWALVMSVVLVGAGCGGSGGPGGLGGPVDARDNLNLIVDYGPDLRASEVRVGCRRDGREFPASALNDMPLVEDSSIPTIQGAVDDAVAAVQFGSSGGWRVLHLDGNGALLVRFADSGSKRQAPKFLEFTRTGDGWRFVSASQPLDCPLMVALPARLNHVEWEVDPAVPPPGPDATSFVVLATEEECVSGQPMGDRLLGPQVVVKDRVVLVAFAATRPGGDAQTCPSNPPTRVTVRLRERLGDRVVRDGLATGHQLADFNPD